LLLIASAVAYFALKHGSPPPAHLSSYRIVRDVPLSGNPSRFDYESLDVETHHLYLAHLGSSTVLVFDTQSNAVVKELPGVAGVHGVIAVPELGRIYASATSSNNLAIFDSVNYELLATVPTGEFPDGIAYDPEDHKIFVSNKSAGTVSIIDARTNTRILDIRVGPDVGNNQYDRLGHRIIIAVGQGNKLVEIDPVTNKITAEHPLRDCRGAHGLYLNSSANVAYVACEDNDKLLTVDMRTWMVIASFSVGGTPDVLAFDDQLSRLYVASESGSVAIFQVNAQSLEKIAQGYAGPNAHSVAVDPMTHYVYLPLENLDGKPVMRIYAPE